MAGRRHRLEPPTRALDPLAIRQRLVRRIVEIECRVGAWAIVGDRERRAADDRRAGPGGERAARRAVVAMGVGAGDSDDPLALGRGEDRIYVLSQIRPGIDHRDIATADDIGLRAGKGEGGGIGGEHAPDERMNLLNLSGRHIGHGPMWHPGWRK